MESRALLMVTGDFEKAMRAPRGVTRLDLLLVLSVIVLLAQVMLPAIQQAREVARRSQCKHNLKQVGMALMNYVEAYESFPAGFDVSPDGNYLGWGWNLKILPYLNAGNLYNTIEPHRAEGIHGLPNTAEYNGRLTSLWCPSNPRTETVPHAMVVTGKVVNGIVSEGEEDWQNRLPRSNYFGNAGYLQLEAGGILPNAAGIPTSLAPLTNRGSLGHFGTNSSADHRYCDSRLFGGVFGQNSDVSQRDITDGTSNTFAIGERYSPTNSSAFCVGHGSWIGVPDCTRAQGLAMALADTSVRINIGLPHREPTTGFGSPHQHGAHFVFCDGRVRFVSHLIDLDIFRNISVIDDGERPDHYSDESD